MVDEYICIYIYIYIYIYVYSLAILIDDFLFERDLHKIGSRVVELAVRARTTYTILKSFSFVFLSLQQSPNIEL